MKKLLLPLIPVLICALIFNATTFLYASDNVFAGNEGKSTVPVIIIDPGHGGPSVGTSRNGILPVRNFSGDMMFDAGEKLGGNCGNLWAFLPGNKAGATSVLFSAHMDGVEPCGGTTVVQKDGYLYSDGTTIAEGQYVSMINGFIAGNQSNFIKQFADGNCILMCRHHRFFQHFHSLLKIICFVFQFVKTEA